MGRSLFQEAKNGIFFSFNIGAPIQRFEFRPVLGQNPRQTPFAAGSLSLQNKTETLMKPLNIRSNS
jgi:hypothetical protein